MLRITRSLVLALTIGLCIFAFAACAPKPSTTPSPDNSGQSAAAPEKKPAIKVALDCAYKPMEFLDENNNITGFDADLIKAIASEMGRDVELLNVGWDEIFDNLYAKKYDAIISSVSINEERQKTMLFSDPYYEASPVILVRNDIEIKDANDLKGKKVAVQAGTTAHDLISKNIAGVTIVKFDSADDALEAFANKKADAVSLDSFVIYDYAKQKNDPTYKVVTDDKFFPKEPYGIAVSKDNTQLVSEINAALKKIKENGKYDEIYNKYFKAN